MSGEASELLDTDVLVIGAGAAGLETALRIGTRAQVLVLCKKPMGSGAATAWAQGGIAAAIGEDDSPDLHVDDTERVGAGLNDHHVVEILVRGAGERIAELIALGAHFDREPSGDFALGQEAAHSRRRILHAGGDATGREVLRALTSAMEAAQIPTIVANVERLVVDDDRVVGALARTDRGTLCVRARAVVLATGGCGSLYQYTTNPPEATGDGITIAARAGAELADLEFVQFHPTALATGGDPLPLLTEALRGEGARLVHRDGTPLMQGRDPRGDLAPRDVVARAIFFAVTQGDGAFIDARGITHFEQRFPTAWSICTAAGLDPRTDLLPVVAAAHYHMGGISVDDCGRTTRTGLWACGETASTGAHGANRLASNSLLEALVFAARVADDIVAALHALPSLEYTPPPLKTPGHLGERDARIAELRALMYEHVGIVRDEAGLSAALSRLRDMQNEAYAANDTQLDHQCRVAMLITKAAIARHESRGSHFRRDFPEAVSALAHRSHVPAEDML